MLYCPNERLPAWSHCAFTGIAERFGCAPDAQRPTLRTSINPPNTVLGIMEAIRYAIRDDASGERYELD